MDLIPGWVKVLVLCLAIAAGMAACKARDSSVRAEGVAEGREEVQALWKAAIDDENRDRARKDAQAKALKEKDDAIRAAALNRALADAAAARSARDGLLFDLQRFTAARGQQGQGGQAGAGGQGQPGAGPLDLLADLLSRADGTAGDLAGYADRLLAAGQSCERRYDALEVTQ